MRCWQTDVPLVQQPGPQESGVICMDAPVQGCFTGGSTVGLAAGCFSQCATPCILASPSISQLGTWVPGELKDEEAEVHLLGDSLVPVPVCSGA